MSCEQFVGRLRQICRGEAGLSLSDTNRYRAHWGLPPLTQVDGQQPSPSLLRLAWTFTRALARHAADGCRRRTKREIAKLAAICETCDKFDGRVCTSCGCGCSAENLFLNKLAWRSEQCPENKWPLEVLPK